MPTEHDFIDTAAWWFRVCDQLEEFLKLHPGYVVHALNHRGAGALGARGGAHGEEQGFLATACHTGYATKQTEEAMTGLGGASEELERRVVALPGGVGDKVAQIVPLALEFASAPTAYGAARLARLPGPDHAFRDKLKEWSLTYLTAPGAEFERAPGGLSADQISRAWDFGFALRCCLVSVPGIVGEGVISPVPEARLLPPPGMFRSPLPAPVSAHASTGYPHYPKASAEPRPLRILRRTNTAVTVLFWAVGLLLALWLGLVIAIISSDLTREPLNVVAGSVVGAVVFLVLWWLARLIVRFLLVKVVWPLVRAFLS